MIEGVDISRAALAHFDRIGCRVSCRSETKPSCTGRKASALYFVAKTEEISDSVQSGQMATTTFFHSCLGVFQGGGCRAAALVGAYAECVERGVHFVEVAGTSAGAIVAALIGAGATPSELSEFVRALDFTRFQKEPEKSQLPPWYLSWFAKRFGRYADLAFHQGFYSSGEIERWVEDCLRQLIGPQQGPIAFSQLPYPTSVVATDILRRQPHVWNQRLSPSYSVAKAVRASCSIPFFFQPVERRYVDGGALSNLPAFVFKESATGRPMTSRILAFELKGDDDRIDEWGTLPLIGALANAIVDGAQHLQTSLQSGVHTVRIPTGSVRATDFDKIDAATVSSLVTAGRVAAKEFLDGELAQVMPSETSALVCYDREHLYNRLTLHLNQAVTDVLISEFDTKFVYEIFPSLLLWRMRGAMLRVALSRTEAEAGHGAYRRRLLKKLGAEVVELDEVPYRGYFINGDSPAKATAYVAVHSSQVEATVYDGPLHQEAIAALHQQIRQRFASSPRASEPPEMASGSHDALLSRLRSVAQYSKAGVALSIERVPLKALVALVSHVREYKYRQFEHWVPEFGKRGLGLFDPADVVLTGAATSIITPPVVEASGREYVLLEGSTRATFLRDQNKEELTCVVVRGMSDPLPGKTCPFRHVRVVGRRLETEVRYDKFDYGLFRQIEAATHPIDSLAT